MIDALIYAVRDGIRAAGFNYGIAECEIMSDGHPPPRCGNFFVAVHGGRSSPGRDNERNLYELFGFSVTLTMRTTLPLDRIGDQAIYRNSTLIPFRQREGFNAKLEQLRTYLHSNWKITVLQNQIPNSANDNIVAWTTGTSYGFCEPARWKGQDIARLVGSEWFESTSQDGDESTDDSIGIVSEMRFDGAKRMQPQTASIVLFV